jgi:hypothetical protein
MSSVPSGSDTRLSSVHSEEDSIAAATNVSSTNPAAAADAAAVSTDNASSATIAAAVAAALVAAGISGTKAENGKGKTASAAASKKGKKGAKGKNFTQAEINCMLELIEEHMPLCNSKWQQVVDEHMMYFPETDRNVDALRRKFNALAGQKVPTGDPFIPPDVKKAQKIRKELSKFSGLKTGSPEKMEINFNKINSKGGALDDESLNLSSNLEEFKDSVEDLRSDSDKGSNKEDEEDEDDDDDEGKIVARSNLRDMAAASSSKKSKTTPMMRSTSSHPVVTREFSSTTFSKRREGTRKSNKKRSLDEDDDDGNDDMNSFMKMFIMQSERERVDRERDREERRRQEEEYREERRVQMAQAKATQDMVQLMLMRSMGIVQHTAAVSMVANEPAANNDSCANKKSVEEEQD